MALYEIGHVYPPGPGELPDEREMLGVVLAGAEAPAAIAVWRELAAALDVGARIDQQRVPAGLHPTRSATLVAGRATIGAVGEVAPGVLDAYGIDRASGDPRGRPVACSWPPSRSRPDGSRRAGIRRAISTWRSCSTRTIPAEKLEKAIRQGAGNLLVGIELFDVYRGRGVAAGTRSLAYRLRLQAPDRTLTDADTAAVVAQVRAAAAKLGATLRACGRPSAADWSVNCCVAARDTPSAPSTPTGWRSVPGEVVGGVGEPAEAAGLAPQDAPPELVGSAVNTSDGLGVDDDPRARLDLRLELAGLPSGVAAEHPQGVDLADHERRIGGEVGRGDVAGERREVACRRRSSRP